VWRFGRASDEEALRIVLAYLKINDPERRKEIMTLAEAYAEASEAQLVQDNKEKK
jgi:hypothetical protein